MVNKFTCKNLPAGEEGKSTQTGNPLGRQGVEPLRARADLRFSRGGGGRIFKKPFKNFDDLFICFRSTIDFPSTPKALKRRCYGQIFCAACNFVKNMSKNRFKAFLENFDKKFRFLARAPPQG